MDFNVNVGITVKSMAELQAVLNALGAVKGEQPVTVKAALAAIAAESQSEQSNAPAIKSAANVPAATSAARPAMEEARAVLAELVRQGKKPEIKALLQEFGAVKLVDVPAENLGELLSKAREIN